MKPPGLVQVTRLLGRVAWMAGMIAPLCALLHILPVKRHVLELPVNITLRLVIKMR